MNSLDRVILGQLDRVKAVQGDPSDVLHESESEILAAATPELTLEIIQDHKRSVPERETHTLTAQMRAFDDPRSITSRAAAGIRAANGLVRIGMLAPDQGYVGGIVFDGDDATVYGSSMVFQRLKATDAIQEAMGDTFYPPMMWVKALHAASYENRPESARSLSVAGYLARLGLYLGSTVTENGDLLGATGFMPGERLTGAWENPVIQEHIGSEAVEAYRLSGLCDQAVVEPNILTRTPEFAEEILQLGGSLN